ncbi:MAG TPA: polysaccharide deacetylase family protein [Pyrinomonadaceae bacterium]
MQSESLKRSGGAANETRRRIPIITYHSIDDSGSIISTSPELFRRQIATLSEEGYRSVSLGDLAGSLRTGSWPRQRSVVLTFDDGFENFITKAAPILSEYSFSATVFLVTEKCGGFNEWPGNPPDLPRSRLLSWSQVKELSAAGFEFGSHTLTHPDLTVMAAERSAEEISRSKRTIEDLIGARVVSFAYPFGRISPSIRTMVEEIYAVACSTNLGRTSPLSDVHSLERIDAYYLSDPNSLRKLESPLMDGYFACRQVLRNLRNRVSRSYARASYAAPNN